MSRAFGLRGWSTTSVSRKTLSDMNGRVRGGFFGPGHEEITGVLDDRTVGVNLMAGLAEHADNSS